MELEPNEAYQYNIPTDHVHTGMDGSPMNELNFIYSNGGLKDRYTVFEKEGNDNLFTAIFTCPEGNEHLAEGEHFASGDWGPEEKVVKMGHVNWFSKLLKY